MTPKFMNRVMSSDNCVPNTDLFLKSKCKKTFLLLSVSTDFTITVTPSTTVIPREGENLKIRCEVSGPLRVDSPPWRDRNDTEIKPLGLGKNYNGLKS